MSSSQPPSTQQLLSEQPSILQANGSSEPATGLQAPLAPGPSPLPQQLQQYPLASPSMPTSATMANQPQQLQPQFPPGVKVHQGEQGMLAPQQTIGAQRPPSAALQQLPPQIQSGRPTNTFPGSLSDLVVSFENVKQKGTVNVLSWLAVHLTKSASQSSPSDDQPGSCAQTTGRWILERTATSRHGEVGLCVLDRRFQSITLHFLGRSTTSPVTLTKRRHTIPNPQTQY